MYALDAKSQSVDEPQDDDERGRAIDAELDHVDAVRAALAFVLDAHQKWLAGQDGRVPFGVPPGTNLTQARLKGVILQGADLKGVDMRGSATDRETQPPNGFMRMPKPDHWSGVLDTSARHLPGTRDR